MRIGAWRPASAHGAPLRRRGPAARRRPSIRARTRASDHGRTRASKLAFVRRDTSSFGSRSPATAASAASPRGKPASGPRRRQPPRPVRRASDARSPHPRRRRASRATRRRGERSARPASRPSDRGSSRCGDQVLRSRPDAAPRAGPRAVSHGNSTGTRPASTAWRSGLGASCSRRRRGPIGSRTTRSTARRRPRRSAACPPRPARASASGMGVERPQQAVSRERSPSVRPDGVELVADLEPDPVAEAEMPDDRLLQFGLIRRRDFACAQRHAGPAAAATRGGNRGGGGQDRGGISPT